MTTVLDLAAIKGRQQKTWASGDYSAVAARIHPMAEPPVQAADLPAGGAGARRGLRQRQRRAWPRRAAAAG